MSETTTGQTTPGQTATRGIERRTIDMIPDEERHGSPWNQFTLWFGANLQITAIVDGALAVVFGADALWAIIGLFIGQVLGGIVMALHSAQGPRLGLPQMISSRAQFGVFGAAIPLVLVVLLYLGFASTGTVLSGQAINAALGIKAPIVGIAIFAALTALVAIIGHNLIHALGRIASVVGILGLGYLAIRLFQLNDFSAAISQSKFEIAPFLLAVSLSAGWQLTYGPYVADYSRYLPRTTKESTTFWATFLGSVGGATIAMTLGVFVAQAGGKAFMANQVGYLGGLAQAAWVAVLIYLVIVVGKLTINTLNAYGGFMSIATTLAAFTHKDRVSPTARVIWVVVFNLVAAAIALWATADFLNNFKNFVLALLMVFTPWSAINLLDYYLISKEKVDIPALYDPKGRYRGWQWGTIAVYVIGVLVQIPFMAQKLYTGPITKMLGGVDISWIVGLVVTALIYYPVAKRSVQHPSRMIYPAHLDHLNEREGGSTAAVETEPARS
ncbi:purine-cytosine permease family protein [Mariniluteicoccus flavus]